MKNVLVVVEGGAVREVVVPNDVYVYILDVDGFKTGDEFGYMLANESDAKEVFGRVKDMIDKVADYDSDCDLSEDYEVFNKLRERFGV